MASATRPAARGGAWWLRLPKQWRTDITGYAFCLPWILGILIFTAYPTVASFYFSLTRYNVLQPPRFIGLRNYVTMFTTDQRMLKAVYNSIYFTALSVPLGLVSSLLLAVLLNARVRLVGVFRTLYYMPSLVPPVAATLLWLLIMDPRDGLMNTVLAQFGLPHLGWFKDPTWSKPGLLLMNLWTIGSATIIFLAALQDVPTELQEASTIDGANAWSRFWKITLPMISPTILFNLVMSILGSFQVFTSAFIAGGAQTMSGGGPSGGGGGPLDSLLMYMVYLYASAFRYFEMGYASAMAVVLFVAIVILTLVIFRTSRRWVYYGGGMR